MLWISYVGIYVVSVKVLLYAIKKHRLIVNESLRNETINNMPRRSVRTIRDVLLIVLCFIEEAACQHNYYLPD